MEWLCLTVTGYPVGIREGGILTPCRAKDMEALRHSQDQLKVKVKGPGMD